MTAARKTSDCHPSTCPLSHLGGMKGVYQHCSEKHLHRYLAEFDFRYNNRSAMGVEDAERTERAIKGIAGKRLTYEGS